MTTGVVIKFPGRLDTGWRRRSATLWTRDVGRWVLQAHCDNGVWGFSVHTFVWGAACVQVTGDETSVDGCDGPEGAMALADRALGLFALAEGSAA